MHIEGQFQHLTRFLTSDRVWPSNQCSTDVYAKHSLDTSLCGGEGGLLETPSHIFYFFIFFILFSQTFFFFYKKIRFNCDEDISNKCYIPINVMNVRGGSRIFGSGVQISWGGSICAVWPFFSKIPHEMKSFMLKRGFKRTPWTPSGSAIECNILLFYCQTGPLNHVRSVLHTSITWTSAYLAKLSNELSDK